MSFTLAGLPEGIVGKTRVSASSLEDLFRAYPQLREVRDRLEVEGTTIRGFMPCIG